MAPRTRSKRAEKLANERLLASGIAPNTRGFAVLPNELYLEILSNLPALKVPHDSWIDAKPDLYRQLTLFSLSQTCQSLRRFFSRYAWERIEVVEGMWTPEGRLFTKEERLNRGLDMKNIGDKKLVQEILRQLETVTIRNPELAQYVHIVNLEILKYSYPTLLPEIAERMTLLPNLHTLQLNFVRFGYLRKDRGWYLSPYAYPQIHTLSVNFFSPRTDIVYVFPNLRRFFNYKDVDSRDGMGLRCLLNADCATHIEVLGLMPPTHFVLSEIVKCLPSVRDLSVSTNELESIGEGLLGLSSLPLHTLRLRLDVQGRYNSYHPPLPNSDDERRSWISLSKRILEKCPQREEQKRVVVVNHDKTVEIHSI